MTAKDKQVIIDFVCRIEFLCPHTQVFNSTITFFVLSGIGLPFCKKCGRGVNPDATSCKYCGASLVPTKAWIDPTLLVIVLVEIVFLTALGLLSGSLIGYIFATVAIVANVAILVIDLVYRRAQRP